MKIKPNVHLWILTTLIIVSCGMIPSAILRFLLPIEIRIPNTDYTVPLNIMLMSTFVLVASVFRKKIYNKLSEYIYGKIID